MSTYTRRKHSPQGKNVAGKSHSVVCTESQHGVVPGRRADEKDQLFPKKPVSHRRPLNPKTHDSLEAHDFEKISITKRSRDPLSTQEHSGKDSQTPPRELQMARAIHEKELLLQEKLCRVEEKIRQNIHRDSADAAEKERGKVQTKTRLSEQQSREPVRGREKMMQEDVKQLKRQNQRNEDKMRNTHEEEEARWKRKETEVAQSSQLQTKGRKETHEIGHGHEVGGESNKSRWENVKKHSRRKGEGDKDNRGETGLKSQDVTEKAKEGGTLLAPISSPSHSSRPEQEELRLKNSTDPSNQLLPCRVCNRKFASERLEKHVQICKKVKQTQRQVFNSYVNRTKGSVIEEFWKTHSRPKTSEVAKKKNIRQTHKSNTGTLHEVRLPAGTSRPKQSK
ncbi:Zinc finger C2HC domain-containing protein 1B [Collichthys lucidus]|uniref:Zinc finger C2HC domain-containing protein 1B n=1 Tax=Collichthys lucidus TaxID=240159 RepID=A0A4V6ATA1_COLLU|nr:Zinc finger C2HC domain-containing protein 1B [Collichthys lucidus]